MADAFRPVPILHISDLHKVYDAANSVVEALRGIDLTIHKGEFVCLLGASGCGKSTLLRIIAGFEKATRGTVAVYGVGVTGPGPTAAWCSRTMRYSLADGAGQHPLGPLHRRTPQVAEIAERFRPWSAHTVCRSLSASAVGGMKQRVAIARVLANDADILLMDEPFGALDALTRGNLQQELMEIWRTTRLTVIFVTHSVEEAVLLADHIVVMTAGPGRVDKEVTISLPRPRDVSSPEFNVLRRDVTRLLTSHLASGQSLTATAEA